MQIYNGNSVEHNSLVPIQNNPPLSNILDGGSKNITLDITASMGQLLGAHPVVDPHDILLNNRALIQIASNKVGRSANDLDTAVISLVVGLGALERGQETVMDVDDAPGHGLAQGRREDLHVAGQDDQVDVVFARQVQDLGFLLRLGVGGDGEVVEGDVVGGGERSEVRVVGDDQWHFNAELAG